MKFYELNNWWW